MMSSFVSRIFPRLFASAISCLAAHCAHADGAAADNASASVETARHAAVTAAQARHHGALFRLKHGEQIVYLFGTVHVGTSDFYPLAPGIDAALADASKLVLELDIRADDAFQQAVRAHGTYPAGDAIGKHLSAETMGVLTAALRADGIALADVAHLKPWLLANVLMGLELQRHGYERSKGLETYLLAAAQTRGTAVAELESADYQLAMFDTLSDADGERYLRESLCDLANGSSLKRAKALIDAWTSGDEAALDAVIADATGGDSLTADFTRRTLLGRRNPEMAASIERVTQGSKVTFVGVGLLHLLGDNGLPRLMARRGYEVERIN